MIPNEHVKLNKIVYQERKIFVSKRSRHKLSQSLISASHRRTVDILKSFNCFVNLDRTIMYLYILFVGDQVLFLNEMGYICWIKNCSEKISIFLLYYSIQYFFSCQSEIVLTLMTLVCGVFQIEHRVFRLSISFNKINEIHILWVSISILNIFLIICYEKYNINLFMNWELSENF